VFSARRSLLKVQLLFYVRFDSRAQSQNVLHFIAENLLRATHCFFIVALGLVGQVTLYDGYLWTNDAAGVLRK
jgi:hypothetical protein